MDDDEGKTFPKIVRLMATSNPLSSHDREEDVWTEVARLISVTIVPKRGKTIPSLQPDLSKLRLVGLPGMAKVWTGISTVARRRPGRLLSTPFRHL
jgi:hypothetical protein